MAQPESVPGPARPVLVGTKFQTRPAPSGGVERRRLWALLDAHLGPSLVVAPPGYGKTTVLTNWCRAADRPTAWVSLDEADNDPLVLWRYVVAAIDAVEPGLASGALDGPGEPDVLATVVPRVLNRVGSLGTELVLVLDDYQAISNPACHRSVEQALLWAPANLRLVLASRADPPLRIERLRAAGGLLVLRWADLAFTPGESGQLLDDLGLDASADAVTTLHERTEGWPAGLNLAYLSVRDAADREAAVSEFRGSWRHVADYLTEVVLEPLERAARDFLIDTSVLDTVCGPLGDAVTGHRSSAALLEHLERTGRFVMAVDGRRRWYRYHRLFADLLRDELDRLRPERRPTLHLRASGWLAEAGRIEEAARHAIAAGEYDTAAKLVASTDGAGLTDRELDVLQLLERGLSKREVAGELFVSYNTIHTHARSIYRKLGASSRREALARAHERGLLPGWGGWVPGPAGPAGSARSPATGPATHP
jgi:LuxR family transcriptional regulator, maltose regulon positive regulatory protein